MGSETAWGTGNAEEEIIKNDDGDMSVMESNVLISQARDISLRRGSANDPFIERAEKKWRRRVSIIDFCNSLALFLAFRKVYVLATSVIAKL